MAFVALTYIDLVLYYPGLLDALSVFLNCTLQSSFALKHGLLHLNKSLPRLQKVAACI